MKRTDELKLEISAKKEEVEKLQAANKIKDAVKVANELEKLLDALKVEEAKEKADFENFLKNAVPIDAPPKHKFVGGVAGEDYHKNFINAFRQKFRNELRLKEASPATGGYLLPSEFHAEILSKLENENPMRQLATVIQTQSDHKICVVSTPPTASWVGEGQAINFTQETFNQLTLGAFKCATSISVSNELLADSFYNLEEHLTGEFSKALARAEEEKFITGSGVNEPTGVLTSIEANTECQVTSAHSVTINSDSLINLMYSLPREYRRNACWLVNDATLKHLWTLKDATDRPLWQPSLSESEPATILGRPVYTTSYLPVYTGANSEVGNIPILFGDFSRYFVADRGERAVKALREIFALQDLTAFLMIERVDGILTDLNAVRGLKLVA
jgi:HK97 family phage major capsid protein